MPHLYHSYNAHVFSDLMKPLEVSEISKLSFAILMGSAISVCRPHTDNKQFMVKKGMLFGFTKAGGFQSCACITLMLVADIENKSIISKNHCSL